MASHSSYDQIEKEIEKWRTDIKSSDVKEPNLVNDSQETLKAVLKEIEQLVEGMDKYKGEESCAALDVKLINIFRSNFPDKKGLIKVIIMKLMMNAYTAMTDQHLKTKPKLLVYSWRCRLLSLLMYDLREPFKQWADTNDTSQGVAKLAHEL